MSTQFAFISHLEFFQELIKESHLNFNKETQTFGTISMTSKNDITGLIADTTLSKFGVS